MMRTLCLIVVALTLLTGMPRLGAAQTGGRGTEQGELAAFQETLAKLDMLTEPEQRIAVIEDELRRLNALQKPLSDLFWKQKGGLLHELGQAFWKRHQGNRAENLERAIAANDVALTVYTRNTFPQGWATVQGSLGNVYQDRIRGERADNLERTIAAYDAALTVFTRDAFPQYWATTQNNLGKAYCNRIRGERADNFERAVAVYEAALTVYNRDAFPQDWAKTQNNLGDAYQDRIRGERADNLERAIAAHEAALTVFTRDAFPQDWATTQNSLGNAYQDRIRGEHADNLERAIAAFESALTVYIRADFPKDWAMTQSNLGNAYQNRVQGEHADNLERAIAAYEAALTVRTRDILPRDWAATQNNLGIAYSKRIRGGGRADNLERAIAAYEAALTVRTPDAFPKEDWATTQNNLGIAYSKRIRGERADNLERAIAAYQEVLSIYTRVDFPQDWAMTQNNLGTAYLDRIRGERTDNLVQAIAAFERALTVYTHDAFPQDWAKTQYNLGNAYSNHTRGERADNLERAIAAYEAALTVFTRDASPRDHIQASRHLGRTLSERGDWTAARRTYGEAITAVRDITGDGFDGIEAQRLLDPDVIGTLFQDAAYAEARGGDGERAMEIMEEGRAHLLRATLRLNALSLSDSERDKLLDLSARIHNQDNQLAKANLASRAAIVDQLGDLRLQRRALIDKGQSLGAEEPVMVLARRVVPTGGAVVVPIVTGRDAVLLVLANTEKNAAVTVHALPELTEDHWRELLFGSEDAPKLGGWLGAYMASYASGELVADESFAAWQRQIATTSSQLWKMIGHDMVAILSARGVAEGARVVWMPPGMLGLIPIGLSHDETGRFLLDRYEFVATPTLRALATAAPATAPNLGALVNPTNDLKFAPIEGALVAHHFPVAARTVLGPQEVAAIEPVLAALSGKTHWHLSSHGRFSWGDDPQKSGIVLAYNDHQAHEDHQPHDVILSVRDLLMRLGKGTPPRLVVLSACESGLSDISRRRDEYFGLPMALLAGGARAVLGTLWPVDDLATMFLIAKFYDLHLGPDKLSPATALHQAQVWLREATTTTLRMYMDQAAKENRLTLVQAASVRDEGLGNLAANAHPFADPVYWAGFIMTGL